MHVVVPFYFILCITLYNRAFYHGAHTSITPSITEFSSRGKIGRLMLYAYGYMRIDVQAGGALISALVNGVPQQCG